MPKVFASGISYLARYIAVVSIMLLGACATVDFDYPKEESHALVPAETSETYLGTQIMPVAAEHPGESGFYLQFDGIDALAGRFVLARYAEKTIDAQYYLISNDKVGMLFIGALLQAADRGVRVRLLLDDIQTQGYDAGMAALDSHPNFEVRIFNPFASRSARFMDAFSFSRVNRRFCGIKLCLNRSHRTRQCLLGILQFCYGCCLRGLIRSCRMRLPPLPGGFTGGSQGHKQCQ